MSLIIQRTQSDFLYQQVIKIIREMQESNTLRPGDRLPSLRSLSEKLSVSIATVIQAYGELERQGVIEARPKSGYFLKPAKYPLNSPTRVRAAAEPTTVRRQSLIEQVTAAIHKPDVVPFGIANPTAARSSDKALARIMRQVISRAGAKAVAYAPMDGYAPLKRQLALRYLDFGLQLNPDEILICNGAQEALSIALQCVAKPGDIIAVESPTYFGILELIENLGMLALEIPLCPEQGVWIDDLEQSLLDHQIKACIFSSSISNPMGSLMPQENRLRLVEVLESNDIPLIEDDVYGDLHFGEKRGVPAQCYSKKGLVLTCSSFSKTIAPGYRIGWLVTERYAEKALQYKRAFSCSSPLLNQWTLSEFLSSGEYDRSIRNLRQVLRSNKERMIALIRNSFPIGTRISNPQGGGVLWLELPAGNDSEIIFKSALQNNISITPGALFSPSSKFDRCIRISYGIQWTEEVEKAIVKLGSLCTS